MKWNRWEGVLFQLGDFWEYTKPSYLKKPVVQFESITFYSDDESKKSA